MISNGFKPAGVNVSVNHYYILSEKFILIFLILFTSWKYILCTVFGYLCEPGSVRATEPVYIYIQMLILLIRPTSFIDTANWFSINKKVERSSSV